MAAGYTSEDGEVTLAYDDPTSLRAIAVATGQLAARFHVTPPPGIDFAIAPNEGPTFLVGAADDGERAYARLSDSRGTLFEGGTFWTLLPAMDPPALMAVEEDGVSSCVAANGSMTRSVVVHVRLDEPIDLHRGEYAFGELGGSPALAVVPIASAMDLRREQGTEDGPTEDTGYNTVAAVFRLAEAPEP